MRKLLLLMFISMAGVPYSLGQSNSFCQAHADTLYCKIPALFGNAVINPLEPLDEALGTQLTLVPLASPASGLVYVLDPRFKTPTVAGTETLGPVLTERGETLYHNKLFIASTYQRFRFNSQDGVNFKHIPMLFTFCTAAGQCGPIATIIRTDVHLDQYAIFGTYGITNRIDVSAALPISRISVDASGVSCVAPYCSFTTSGGTTVSFQNAETKGSSSGIGDVVIRGKVNVLKADKYRMAVGADLRLPTGDTLNFLGAGSVGVKPFLAFSRSGRYSPHVNLGYQWNGQSYLAGKVAGEKGDLPKNFAYTGGLDMGLRRNLTVSVDYLGEHVTDASRLASVETLGLPNTAPSEGDFDSVRAALGFKWNPWRDLLITGNILQKFDHNGLHHTAVPLVGISYTFPPSHKIG